MIQNNMDMSLKLKVVSYLEMEKADLKKSVDRYHLCEELLNELTVDIATKA